jgi:hypothetical protein
MMIKTVMVAKILAVSAGKSKANKKSSATAATAVNA